MIAGVPAADRAPKRFATSPVRLLSNVSQRLAAVGLAAAGVVTATVLVYAVSEPSAFTVETAIWYAVPGFSPAIRTRVDATVPIDCPSRTTAYLPACLDAAQASRTEVGVVVPTVRSARPVPPPVGDGVGPAVAV